MKVKKTLLVIPIFLVSVLLGYRVIRVNQLYPQVKKVDVELGKEQYITDAITMKVISKNMISKEVAEKDFGIDFVKEMEGAGDYWVVDVLAEFKNNSDQKECLTLYDNYIETSNYGNGLAPEAFDVLSSGENMQRILNAYETYEVHLGYVLYEIQFAKGQWENINNEKFYLVNQRYPIKYYWEL